MHVFHLTEKENRKRKDGTYDQYRHSVCGIYDPHFSTPIEHDVTCKRCKAVVAGRDEKYLSA
jgi:hypothetical protein